MQAMSSPRAVPVRPWRGTSAEQRVEERRQRLIAAGLEVIGNRGWANTTVRAVCQEAGLTARYFYEAFPDSQALLLEVFERVRAETVEAVVTAFAAAPDGWRAKAHAAISAAAAVLLDDPRKGRVLLIEAASDERLQRRRQETTSANAELLAGIARGYAGDVPYDPTDAQLTAIALVGAETELITAYLAGRLDITRERLIDHITELHLAVPSITSVPNLRGSLHS